MRATTVLALISLAGFTLGQPDRGIEFPPTKGTHHVLIDRVVDGDSVKAFFLVSHNFRLDGIQAPEKKSKHWQQSKDALSYRLKAGRIYRVELKGPYKYAGGVMGIFYDEEGESVNQWLLDRGHAAFWNGRGPKP